MYLLELSYNTGGYWAGRWYLFKIPRKYAAWVYFSLFTILSIVSWVLRDYGGTSGCRGDSLVGTTGACGALAVLRISFGNILFFCVLTILTLGVDEEYGGWRSAIHRGWWPYKLAAWALLVGCSFLVPDDAFQVIQHIARVLGIIFIVIQMIIFLGLVYNVNTWILERDSAAWNCVLIFTCAILLGSSFAGLGLLYKVRMCIWMGCKL